MQKLAFCIIRPLLSDCRKYPSKLSRMIPFVFRLLHLLIHVNLCFSSLNTDHLFNTWCQQHGKSYSSEEEKLFRLCVFEDNLAFVTQHNSMKNTTYSLALNDFADLTYQEFKTSHFGPNFTSLDDPVQSVRKSPLSPRGSNLVDNVATSIDWRKKERVVTPVQNETSTCSDYTYHAGNRFCSKYKDDYAIVPANNEGQLLQAVAAQPVHAGICANERTFQFYSKGIFTGPCSTTLDHAVLIVGYDSENGFDYWIVKNSWGTNWGMNGYMYILRNSGNPEGICGINTLASYTIKNIPNLNPLLQRTSSVRVSCDLLRYCRDGETCCCSKRFIICLTWICCKNAGAVCCDDHERCCPHGYACDAGICYKDHDNFTATRMLEQSSSWTFQG